MNPFQCSSEESDWVVPTFCYFFQRTVYTLAHNIYHGHILIFTSLERKGGRKGTRETQDTQSTNIKAKIKEGKKLLEAAFDHFVCFSAVWNIKPSASSWLSGPQQICIPEIRFQKNTENRLSIDKKTQTQKLDMMRKPRAHAHDCLFECFQHIPQADGKVKSREPHNLHFHCGLRVCLPRGLICLFIVPSEASSRQRCSSISYTIVPLWIARRWDIMKAVLWK